MSVFHTQPGKGSSSARGAWASMPVRREVSPNRRGAPQAASRGVWLISARALFAARMVDDACAARRDHAVMWRDRLV